ncbi:hypothetical protein WA026_014541 [Henosepilachna vigintioctopunctata]|uniref:CHHC U11-48K-type domain-containing protein n=1 Tax=Henosepilachna vigintioctopunctata TaxID=420089 RepID=A0AAW1UL10_9CUCU
MDFNIEIRKKQLENLDQFISSSRNKLQSLLEQFGWTEEKIVEDRQYVTCPYNDAHKLLTDKIDDHIEKCKLKSAGYDLNEEFLSEPYPIVEDRKIKIDALKKIEVLSHAITQTPYFQTAWNGQDAEPQTYSRLITTFSRDERLALYNYCVSNTKGPQVVPEFDTSFGPEREKNASFTEEALMSFERDIKRRSVKYKPIHTNHKNYKEILKEVINSQMHQYRDWLIEKNHCKGPHTPEYHYDKEYYQNKNKTEDLEKALEVSERPHSSISRISNHSSSSRSTVKRRERYKEYSPHGSRNNSKERRRSHHKEDNSNIKSDKLIKYEHNDEDSRGSNMSKFSITHKSEHAFDEGDFLGDHSRDSSVHSSYKHKDRNETHTRYNRKRRSRSYSNDRQRKKYHKRRSRSRRRSVEYRYGRDNPSKHRSSRYETR